MIVKLTDEELQKAKQHLEEVTKKDVIGMKQVKSMEKFGYVVGFLLENRYFINILVDDFEQVIETIDKIFNWKNLKRLRKRRDWWLDYRDFKPRKIGD